MTDELKGLLTGQVEDVVLAPGGAERALAGARARRRSARVGAGALVLSLCGVGSAVALTVRGDDADSLVPADQSVATGNAALLLRDGDRVQGSGRVVQIPGRGPQLCGPENTPAVGYAEGMEPAPAACRQGLDLVGVNMDQLSDRRSKDGAVEGRASITGTYRDGVITVEEQRAAGNGRPFTVPTEPPCDPPAGGWPAGSPTSVSDALFGPGSVYFRYTAAHPGLVVVPAIAYPAAGRVAIVLLARDAAARDAIDAGLRPAYGDLLCVVVARRPAAEVQAAQDEITSQFQALGLSVSGIGRDEEWQQQLHVSLFFVSEAALALADRFPAGLVALEPSLRPVR